MIVKCRKCNRKLRTVEDGNDGNPDYTLREVARSILLDPGRRGDGSGSLFIMMQYVISMSEMAGPFCPTDALAIINDMNGDRL